MIPTPHEPAPTTALRTARRFGPPPLAETLFPTTWPSAPAGTGRAPSGDATPAVRSQPSPTGQAAGAEQRPQVSIMRVLPWPDPVIDRVGVDPRSEYVEQFWLGVVGPASVWMLRHLAVCFDEQPDGFELDLTHTARVLGLGTGLGRWGPVQRTIHRCVSFGFAQRWGDGRLLARRNLPPVTRQQLAHLPEDRQDQHEQWRKAALTGPPTVAAPHRTAGRV